MWNPIKRILKSVQLPNAEASDVYEVGVDDVAVNTDEKSVDWGDKLPKMIIPSIKNLRLCAEETEIVNGIIEDLVIKSISGWVVEGNNEAAREYIIKELERLDMMNILHETARNNMIDGAMYWNKVVQNGKLYLRELAFDGDNYRIKEIYDDLTGSEVIGYKQIVKKNKNTNRGWQKKEFRDLTEEQEEVEYNFLPDQVLATHFFTRHGKHKGMVENVLDEAYMLNLLLRMMPQVVYKQANTMILHKDKDSQVGLIHIAKTAILKAVNALTNYHKKGVIYLPEGLTLEMIGDTNLPKIPYFIEKFEKHIFMGLSTPPSVFDGSSSNRSTAVVQLDSDKSGRVLFQQYLQNKLYVVAQIIINWLLELGNFPKDSVWINFNPQTDDDGNIMTENNTVSTSKPGDGLNLNNIQNGEGRVAEVSA